MIPLRYIEIDKSLIPDMPQRGQPMPLERALILLLLDPEREYAPSDLAKLLCGNGDPDQDKSDYQRLLRNARRSYADLARKSDMDLNPGLSGAQWASLVQSGLGAVAVLMDELKQRMASEPGAVFALDDAKLIRIKKGEPAPVARTPQMSPGRALLERAPIRRAEAAWQRMKLAVARLPLPLALGQWFQGGVRTGVLSCLLILPFVMGASFSDIDELSTSNLQELGAPYHEAPFMMAFGKRYEIGDCLRFEGVRGLITKITRQGVWIDDHFFPAPDLIFFDREMAVEGNFVVYPGSPRHIAGNFWVFHTDDLEKLDRGHISWLGGFWRDDFSVRRGSLVMADWSQITGRSIVCHGDTPMLVQADHQFDEFLDLLVQEGAEVRDDEHFMEIFLP